MRRPLLAALLCSTIGCPVGEEPPPGVGGLDGVLAFEAPSELVFSTGISVGSRFEITVRPLDDEEVAFADDADIGVSSPSATVTVIEKSAAAACSMSRSTLLSASSEISGLLRNDSSTCF